MSDYRAFSDDAESLGQSMMSIVKYLGKEGLYPILEKHGLAALEPDKWYPTQAWMDVFNDLKRQVPGAEISNFVTIGTAIVETSALPPEFDTMPLIDILATTDQAYKMNNRGSDLGEYACEKVSDTHVKMVCRVPFPDNYNYGIFYGFARRFLPKGTHFKVFFDQEIPRCEQGGEATIIHITW
jgi:hypothetical protein